MSVLMLLADALFLGFLAYGAWLVTGGGGFRRDAPEDPCQPYLVTTPEL